MPKDSIVDAEVGRALFLEFTKLANGRQIEDVLGAAANLMANCLRQNYGNRREVESRLQELFGRTMQALMDHYDPVTGRRRTVIPFDQSIRPQLIPWDDFSNLGDGRKDN